MRIFPLPFLYLFPLAACIQPPPDERATLARWDAEHQAQLAAFQAEQADFQRRTEVPQRAEFPGLGTLILNDVALVGRPGKAWLRAGFTFINTDSAGYSGSRVVLRLRDPRSGESWGEWMTMQTSFIIHPGPESSYTSWIETPTHDVEFVPGWEWELLLEETPPPGS